MSAELLVLPEVPPVRWETFVRDYPIGSIALDGFVCAAPRFEPDGPYLNLDHHYDVDRLATPSTAQQVYACAQSGMLREYFYPKDGQGPTVYANDCDEDVSVAWYLLNNLEVAEAKDSGVSDFVHVAGMLDVTAGAYACDPEVKLEVLEQMAWVFEPYTAFRGSGGKARKNNEDYRLVIDGVGARIGQHLAGGGESASLDLRYNTIGGGEGWKLMEEVGKEARIGALRDGIDAYVFVQMLPDLRWRYTIGRRDDQIDFDVAGILFMLNDIEGCGEDRWGGGDLIGGSPRVLGSGIPPAALEKYINIYLEQSRQAAVRAGIALSSSSRS